MRIKYAIKHPGLARNSDIIPRRFYGSSVGIDTLIKGQTKHLELRSQLEASLNSISSEKGLLKFSWDYTRFNRVFAGSVLGLASRFHLSDAFKDEHASIIASEIVAAADDEYFDRDSRVRSTHREFSHSFAKGVSNYFKNITFDNGIESQFLSERIPNMIMKGYGVNQPNTDQYLFKGVGFHVASELSGSEEFRAIDIYLRKQWPDLVKFLESQDIGGGKDAYFWIKTHTIVEEEHFNHAIVAASKSVEYYRGKVLHGSQPRENILSGFSDFFDMLGEFVAHDENTKIKPVLGEHTKAFAANKDIKQK